MVELHGCLHGDSSLVVCEGVAGDRKGTYVRSLPRPADSAVMPDASDFDDSQLLAAGDIGGLLARYEPVILGRCIARLKGRLDAEDVAQDVRLRLLDEFRRGK